MAIFLSAVAMSPLFFAGAAPRRLEAQLRGKRGTPLSQRPTSPAPPLAKGREKSKAAIFRVKNTHPDLTGKYH